MSLAPKLAATAGVAVLAIGGYAVATTVFDSTSSVAVAQEPRNCEDYEGSFTDGECFAAGVIRNVSLINLQGAAQFCKWRAANPGEWNRLMGYAATADPPVNIITWFGAHIYNDLEAYFATGAPAFAILPNEAPNVCRTPLPPPSVQGVTPGQTDATVTIETTG